MQKQDLMFFIAAIVIVIVLAVVVKPIMNGETVQILPESKSNTISNIPVPSGASATPYTPVLSQKTLTPTPTPVWDGAPKTVQFVDPSTYNIQWSPEIRDFGFRMPGYEEPENNSFITYATINGQWDATTQVINIPFPYWEIEVSLESIGDAGNINLDTGDDKDSENTDDESSVEGLFASEGESLGVNAENQYYVIPSINVQVMDADKPSGIVYILNSKTEGPLSKVPEITGGLDFTNSDDDEESSDDNEDVADEYVLTRGNIEDFYWKHRFYEGEGNYYFIINPNMLKSYKIDIKVPSKYLSS